MLILLISTQKTTKLLIFPNIDICNSPKNPISVGPYKVLYKEAVTNIFSQSWHVLCLLWPKFNRQQRVD